MDLSRLRDAIAEAFAALSAPELELVTLAMLHGVAVRQLVAGTRLPPERVHHEMIAALKKIRGHLDTAGFSAAELEDTFRAGADRKPGG